MSPIFFVHIPKTAGTSFRKSVENCYGPDSVVYDYSPNSVETSELVRRYIYEGKDPLDFLDHFSEERKRFLTGHVPATKYVHLVGVDQTVTFLRDPIQRVMSEYQHFVRNYGYEGDFPSFYRKPQFINRLSNILGGVALEAFGVLGLTEEYEESLAMLNERYSTEIEYAAMNLGREDKSKNYEIPAKQLDELRDLNKVDYDLYRHGVRIFRARKRLFKDGLPFVHGVIQKVTTKSIRGWAWYADRKTPVEIDIMINGEKVGNEKATALRPGLLQLNPPRKGYVGFQLNFPEPVPEGTRVSAVVSETRQVLGEIQVRASE